MEILMDDSLTQMTPDSSDQWTRSKPFVFNSTSKPEQPDTQEAFMPRLVKFLFSSVAILAITVLSSPAVSAHTVFKKVFQKKYSSVRVSCEACHIKGEDKSTRNDFGQLFYDQLKDQDLTKKWEAFGDDREGKKKFEDNEMTEAFTKALDEIKKMKNDEDVVYDELIKNAKLAGLKPKKSSKSDDEDEDDEDEDEDDDDKGKKDGSAKKDDDQPY
jgi:hypothetical protein